MTRVRAVTFDAAGTLFAPAEPVGVTYARFAADHRIPLDTAGLGTRFRAALASAPPLAFGPLDETARTAHERGWWYRLVRRVFGPAARHPAFEACFRQLYAYYAEPRAWQVFPDAVPALERLRARRLRLAVVSNFDGRLPALLAGLGLESLLDAALFSSAIGSAKPAPAIFHAAAAALGAAPPATLHAGDDPHADVEGALAAGSTAVLVDRAGHRPPLPTGARAIATLAELDALV